MKTLIIEEGEDPPVEERKRRVAIRMATLGKYKGLVEIKAPRLLGA